MAAAALGAQVLALLAIAGVYVYELVLGEGDSTGRVIVSVLLILVTGAGLAAMARSWLGEGTWQRTPTMVWSVILLPVAWAMIQGGQALFGALVGAVGVVGLGAALTTPTPEREPGAGGDEGPDSARG